MPIALTDSSCLNILHCFKEREEYWNSALSTKEVHHLLIVSVDFENPTSPRKDSEKLVVFQKEVLVNFNAHGTYSFVMLHNRTALNKRTDDC